MGKPCRSHWNQSLGRYEKECDRKIEELKENVPDLEYSISYFKAESEEADDTLSRRREELSEISKKLNLAETKNKCWQEKVNKMEQELKVEKDKVDKITKNKSSEIDSLKIELGEQKKKAEYLTKESIALRTLRGGIMK